MLKNIGSNWVLILLTMAATYFLTPFIIRTLGPDGYGTWTLITAMTGYMTILALGVPMASVRYLAQDVAAGDLEQINRTIGTCVGLYLMIGAAALLIGGVLTLFFTALFDIPPALQRQAVLACFLMVMQVSAGFIGLLPEGIMFSHHDFVVRNAVRIAGVFLRFGLTVAALTFAGSLVAMAAVQLACLAFDFSVTWFLIRRRYPGVRFSLGDFDRPVLRRILSFSLYVLLLSAGARLIFETDALIIGAFQDVASIPFYVVANSLIVYVMDFVIAIAAVVSPMATKLSTDGRMDQLRDIFLKWSKVAMSLTVMVGLFLIVLGPSFIGVWIEPSFEGPSGRVLQILMISSLVFLPVRGVAIPILMGMGKPRTPTIAFLITGVLNVALSVLLIGPLGLTGVALGTAIPNVGFAIAMLIVTCRELGVAPSAYVKYAAARTVIGAVPVLLLLQWCKVFFDVHSLIGLAASGSVMVLVFGAIWVWFVYRDDPYVDLKAHLVGRRVWRWSRA
jgi:O-antigen/teichoic acid export membrane protein